MNKVNLKEIEKRVNLEILENDMTEFLEHQAVFATGCLLDKNADGMVDSTEVIKVLMSWAMNEVNTKIKKCNATFKIKGTTHDFYLNLICDKNVIVLDDYMHDKQSNDFELSSTCEILFENDKDIFNVNWNFSEGLNNFLNSIDDSEEAHKVNTILKISVIVSMLVDAANINI